MALKLDERELSANYNDLAVLREQLALVEEIAIRTHRDLWNKNRRNYYLYAEGAIDMILKIRGEIDEFLGIAAPGKLAAANGAYDKGTHPSETMILTHEELTGTREQLDLIEESLVELHRDLWSKNPRNYLALAEGHVEMIRRLRREIDEFLGIAAAPPEAIAGIPGMHADEPTREPAVT